MSTFKQEEVDALDTGGNAVAQRIYCATWSPADFPVRAHDCAHPASTPPTHLRPSARRARDFRLVTRPLCALSR